MILSDCFLLLGQRAIPGREKKKLRLRIGKLMRKEITAPKQQREVYADNKSKAAGERNAE